MADLVFADSETRSLADVTIVGGYKYARHPSTEALVWSYRIDDDFTRVWSPDWAWTRPVDDEPTALLDAIEDGAYFVAWNSFFDRHIWNEVMVKKYGWPFLRLEQVLCAQAQAEASNLPGKLEKAAEAARVRHKKQASGKSLINQLCTGTRRSWTPEHENKMGKFRGYAVGDVNAMADVWRYCRPLTQWEWAEFHSSERINDRGVAVDAEFAAAARNYAEAEFEDINEQMLAITGDAKLTVTNHVRKAHWLHDQLERHDEELAELTRRPPKNDKPRFSADRATREAVLDLMVQPEHADCFPARAHDRIVRVLELIEAGNSAAVRKFTAIVNQEIDGRIHGQYSFCGAGQTGRFSSRGVQIHNVLRSPVDKKNPDRALDAMDDILAGAAPADLVSTYSYPVSRLLARLIRPTFVAPEGKVFVWADWAQIEARVLPWLSMTPGGRDKLELFRSGRDVYKHAAAEIFGGRPDDYGDESSERQVGKVAELALGFGGAVGAFSAMGRNYGVVMDADRVQDIVDNWRRANAWCVNYWHALWEAAMEAYVTPGTWVRAGRVRYLYHPDLMYGTLICELPDTRWIVYPQFRREYVEVEDDDGNKHKKLRTSFVRGFGSGYARVDLWYGVLAENITQATAASALRYALCQLDDIAVLHTHDEGVVEVDEDEADDAVVWLEGAMLYLPDWARDLPLKVDIKYGPYYTK